MLSLRSRLDLAPLFAALGWIAACGPSKGETESTGEPTTDPSASTSVTTATTSSTAPTSSTGPTTGDPVACAGELTELMQGDVDPPVPSGLVRCDDGVIHRVEKRECLVPAAPSSCPADASPDGCLSNDDCTEKPFGSCQRIVEFGGVAATDTDTDTGGGSGVLCTCEYGCSTDADCPEGQICRCAGPELGNMARCIPAGCTVDSDCPGELCGVAGAVCADGLIEALCTSPMDGCDSETDCNGDMCIIEEGKFTCNTSVCGRPFIVDAAPVTAPAVARDDWRALVAAPAAAPALRARLRAHWTAIALAEHASVASFAGFVLQLLAVGAPPALVSDAQRALADEVEHARIAFALASLYEGTGVGPGALPLGAPAIAGDIDAIVAAVIAEACVAETLAGLELREAAAQAEDPALARLLARIAADEQRHAELGWRFVQWALTDAGADRRRAEAAFAAALASAEAAVQDMSDRPGDPELRSHGVVDDPLRAAVWRRGLDGLVRPAAAKLCAA
ncbi:ferritin-like domain-containing protein [Nannocystis sp. SCPEA4]|uniref:ferritin-like domain-containing protein n=1 Tax=Nannocystis sp. SCPEA4 TaxID=2996787 RepID=UPI00226E5426|nr:ferritin-like domain-containing protein [Nannocystis sp. SCPEA4]MCY1061841.1 ferritin-like domain-containing protein [Nannocystis sp. SCPEA4]